MSVLVGKCAREGREDEGENALDSQLLRRDVVFDLKAQGAANFVANFGNDENV